MHVCMHKLGSSVMVGTAFKYLVIMVSAMDFAAGAPTAVGIALGEQMIHFRDTVR